MNKTHWILVSAFGALAGISQLSAADAPDAGPVPSPEEQKAYGELAQKGILVQPLAAGFNWFYVNFRGNDKADPTAYALLKNASGIVDLDLSGQKPAEADWAALAGLKNLKKLNLSKSSVSDGALVHLQGLAKLESLNLFQTEITDAGLGTLKACKELKRLYVFQTKVSDAGVEAIKAAIPGLKVERGGVLLTAPPKKDEAKKDEAKKDEAKKDEAPKTDNAAAPKAEQKN